MAPLIEHEIKDGKAEPEAEQSEPNLERFSEYPGWLWDPSKQEWVPDPDHKGE